MKGYLRHRSRRWSYDGWSAQVRGAPHPMVWTTCTTRAELRGLLAEEAVLAGLRVDVVKVRVTVEVVGHD